MRAATILALAVLALLAPAQAAAGDKELCGASYVDAQRLRRHGALLEARVQIETCLRECSEVVQPECAAWLEEVERALPSIIVSVQRGGVDVPGAVVLVDGAPVSSDARATELDPGDHRVEADVDGARARLDIVLHEQEKGRRVVIDVAPRPAPAPVPAPAPPLPAPPEPSGPRVGAPTIGAGAVGVAGLLTFGSIALYGDARYADLQRCRPRCDPSDVSSVRAAYAAADVALGVGIVALGVAVLSYVLAPRRPSAPRSIAGEGAR